MHLAKISFTNKYLYSPKTWIHLIKIEYKALLLILFLVIIPFTHYIYCITSILTYIYIFDIVCVDYYFLLEISHSLFIYFIFSVCSICFFCYSIANTKAINYPYFYIYYPIKLSIKTNNIKQIIIQYTSWIIPKFFIKIFVFIYLNFIVLQIIFLTTKFENIILLFLNNKKIIKISRNTIFNNLFFISSLGSQFLEFIIQEYTNKNISMKIRKANISKKKYLLYVYVIKSLIINTVHDIKNITSILYSREITLQNFYLIHF